MNIAYHFMIPEPLHLELDGAVQEALWLRERFGGHIFFLYPLRRFSRFVPGSLCGLGSLARLRQLDRDVDLHHLFTPGLPKYPFLGAHFDSPCLCTVQTSQATTGSKARPTALRPRTKRLVVSDPADVVAVERRTGIPTTWIPPGVDRSRFRRTPAPLHGSEFVVLVGSAPWTRRQFATKGIDQLLHAAKRIPSLRLIFLWRGLLTDELHQRLVRAGLGDRTEVVEEAIDVAQLLQRVHAVVVLANRPKLIKAFPHSALEALAAGRPVLTNSQLALADLVRQSRAGVVIDSIDKDAVLAGLRTLMENYDVLAQAAMASDLSGFSRGDFLDSYGRLYDDVLSGA